MLSLAADCLRLLPNLQLVHFDPTVAARYAESLRSAPPALPTWLHAAFPPDAGPALDAVVVVGNALNFSYWVADDAPMWCFEGQVDLFAQMRLLSTLSGAGVDLGSAAVLESAPYHAWFGGGEGIQPMVPERGRMLARLGRGLRLHHGGRLDAALEAAGGSAPGLAAWLAERFPGVFEDQRELDGVSLLFRKRAQLAAGMLHAARLARGAPGLTDLDGLTLYADYMLPRALRHLGVLRYAPTLAARIDAGEVLPVGTRAEVELRVATVGAGAWLCAQVPGLDAARLDFALWQAGLNVDARHHRTRTTDY
jgi:hypothetical protein